MLKACIIECQIINRVWYYTNKMVHYQHNGILPIRQYTTNMMVH